MTAPSARGAARLSLIASFYVYLLPILGPHAGWLVGEMLFQRGNDLVWRLANWGLALLVQVLSFLWFRFCFRFSFRLGSVSTSIPRPGLVMMLLAIPFAWFAIFYGFMEVIPAWRLVEPDLAPEKGGLAEVCEIDGKWITLSGQIDRALMTGSRSELLLQDATGQKYFLLRVPGCAVSELPFPKSTPDQAFAPVGVARGGRILYTTARHRQPNQDYGLLADGKLVPLEPFANLDPGKVSPPKLSPDGGAIAWIVRAPGKSGEARTASVSATGMHEGSRFDLDVLGPGSYDIVDLSAGARELLLARNLREYVLVSSRGRIIWQLTPEPGVRPIFGTIRVAPGAAGTGFRDYMAWEGYREEGRHVVQWRRGEKLVQKEIPLGRAISSADASPDGRFIAASTSPAVSIGSIEDAIVVWSSDGTEVFHKRLSPYNRAPVVFLAGNLVAYSEIDRQGVGVTRVLKLW